MEYPMEKMDDLWVPMGWKPPNGRRLGPNFTKISWNVVAFSHGHMVHFSRIRWRTFSRCSQGRWKSWDLKAFRAMPLGRRPRFGWKFSKVGLRLLSFDHPWEPWDMGNPLDVGWCWFPMGCFDEFRAWFVFFQWASDFLTEVMTELGKMRTPTPVRIDLICGWQQSQRRRRWLTMKKRRPWAKKIEFIYLLRMLQNDCRHGHEDHKITI